MTEKTLDLETLWQELEAAGYRTHIGSVSTPTGAGRCLYIDGGRLIIDEDDGDIWTDMNLIPEDWPALRIIDRHLVVAGMIKP